jgi:hypothetical protein
LNGNNIAPIAGAHARNGFTAGPATAPGSFIRPAYGPIFKTGATQPINRPAFMPAPRQGNLGITKAQPSQPAFRAPQPMRAPAPIMRAPALAPVFHVPPPPPSFHPAAPAGHGR